MSAEDQYRLERMSDERFSDLKFLYEDAFLTSVTEDFLRQKYNTGFTGIKYTGYIAYDSGNKPAAYYGVFPLYAEHRGKTILAAQSGDTMTHSAHRGKGLFIRLAREAYRLAADEGINFIYGFPNMHNSYHGLMKLGWTHYGFINRYRIIVPALPVSFASVKIGSLKRKYDKWVDSVLSKYKNTGQFFENSISQDEYIRIKHDEEYFRYKQYFKKYIITVNGKKVYLKAENTLLIGDIEKCTEEEFWHVISGIKKIAFTVGAPVITFQVSPGTQMDILLAIRYKAEESLPVCCLNLKSDWDLAKLKFSLSDFDTF